MSGRPPVERARRLLVGAIARARPRLRRAHVWARRARLDLLDRLRGRHEPLAPPRRYGLPSQLRAVGEKLVDEALIGIAGLERDERVLDVGCGPGRIAVPLTRQLTGGSYEGFDVMPRSIEWGQRKITPPHPRFRFQLADLHNQMYNPAGSQTAAGFRFPYPDASFDLAFAISVYTHLRPFETDNYLRQTARVLRPGGRTLNTFFLLDDEVEALLAAGAAPAASTVGSAPNLEHDATDETGRRFRSTRADVPEHMIAVPEADVREMHADAGLEIIEIRYGRWSGRAVEGARSFGQDMILARRAA